MNVLDLTTKLVLTDNQKITVIDTTTEAWKRYISVERFRFNLDDETLDRLFHLKVENYYVKAGGIDIYASEKGGGHWDA